MARPYRGLPVRVILYPLIHGSGYYQPSLTSTNPAPDWQAIAQDYAERLLSVEEICLLHDIGPKRLYQRIKDEGWPGRRKPNKYSANRVLASAADMPNRLLRALDMKMTELENRMAAGTEPPTAADCERNARTLNTLVGLFEKLRKQAALDQAPGQKASGGAVSPAGARDADELRRELAERLQRLNRGAGLLTEDRQPGG